ncbi:MAG TPA: DNA-directed RNA polymerase subunit beta', partial [Acidimicrobiia bacterium]
MAQQLFDELKIGLASSDQIRAWSYGEVKKPETINYRTLRPEKEGLFDERIFGPQRDWECYCGKYKRIRYKGIICERCGVEVTRSKVRRERMGHIELAAPVTHIWFFKGVPSRLGYLLDMSPKELEKVIYFASYIITSVDEEKRQKDLPELEAAMRDEIEVVRSEFTEWHEVRLEALEDELERMEEGGAKSQEINARKKEVEREIKDRRERSDREIELIEDAFDTFRKFKPKDLVESEQLWREIYFRYADYFEGGMGAEAVKALLAHLDLDTEMAALEAALDAGSAQKRQRATQRMKVVKPFWEGQNRAEDMILETVPVIPPDLRPMVQLDGGRFATSDLNDLYRRVINRNNRLKRLLDLGAPEIIVNNEKRMLQEAVDALFDNGRRGRAVTGPGNRALKSLSDMLKGKQGRFRQNLLGKRVDYSGRSVIVVGPQLQLHQCGLPKIMALELFKPFVMKRLVDLDLAQNIKAAKRMVERQRPQVWDVLSDVIQEHPVLLNRAPTLHRLGIQAFEPVLVEGKAIQIHPLVCEAFNADFDGDQMAVHLPLSAEAQAEARVLMLSSNNVLSPASGRPIVTPSQDMVIGIYYLSELVEGAPGAGRRFADFDEAMMAHEIGELSVHAPIKIRLGDLAGDGALHADLKPILRGLLPDEPMSTDGLSETTLGRMIINQVLPEGFPFVNSVVIKSDIRTLIETIIDRYPRSAVAETLDGIKDLGFKFATKAGLSIALEDVRTPADKAKILEDYEDRADKVQSLFQKGVVTDEERRQELIEIWTEATEKVTEAMKGSLKSQKFNALDMMVGSGARG